MRTEKVAQSLFDPPTSIREKSRDLVAYSLRKPNWISNAGEA
jgi:hypothetical protein